MSQDVRQLLVLDLDETLIFATETPLNRSADFVVDRFHVYKRPFVDEFLLRVRHSFELAVWTSSSSSYANPIVRALFPYPDELAFVWASDRCTAVFDPDTLQYHRTKKLEKLKRKGYQLERVIVVDDSPETHRAAYGNLVRVHPYEGEMDDDELPKLGEYLDSLRTIENIRLVDTRHWHHRPS